MIFNLVVCLGNSDDRSGEIDNRFLFPETIIDFLYKFWGVSGLNAENFLV